MQAPDNAYDVAWYNFSARPGFGGNVVFAGHVDYIRVGPAVFWNLKDLEPGDLIRVQLADGTEYKYAVSFKQQFDAATAPGERHRRTDPEGNGDAHHLRRHVQLRHQTVRQAPGRPRRAHRRRNAAPRRQRSFPPGRRYCRSHAISSRKDRSLDLSSPRPLRFAIATCPLRLARRTDHPLS